GKEAEAIWVEGRFPSNQGDGPGPKITKQLEPRVQGLEGDRGRCLVVFGAVAAGQIASSRDDQLCQEWSIPEPIQPRNSPVAGRRTRCSQLEQLAPWIVRAHAGPHSGRVARGHGGSIRSMRNPQA